MVSVFVRINSPIIFLEKDMATWITHLRIAENLIEQVSGLEAGAFAIGNIAPDSGIPDEKWENFTPDPSITHFKASPVSIYPIADLNFYRSYLAPLQEQPVNSAVFSLRLGYFFHLVTDNLWGEIIGKPMKKRYQEQFSATPQFISEVKEDWYGQDFIYVQNHPGSLFWSVFLNSQPDAAADGLEFLPLDALTQRVEYIKAYYQRRDDEIMRQIARPMIYLSTDDMDHFVETATKKIQTVYEQLWIEKHEIGNSVSVLDWVD
jgi:hypothetical protein